MPQLTGAKGDQFLRDMAEGYERDIKRAHDGLPDYKPTILERVLHLNDAFARDKAMLAGSSGSHIAMDSLRSKQQEADNKRSYLYGSESGNLGPSVALASDLKQLAEQPARK